MAEDNNIPMARPSAEDAQRLVDNGFITAETAGMLVPEEQAEVVDTQEAAVENELPSTVENQVDTPEPLPAREIVPITEVPELSGRDVAVKQDFENIQDDQIQQNVDNVIANEVATEVVKKDIEKKSMDNLIENKKLEKQYQDIEEEKEVAQEANRKKEALKSDITSKEAVRAVAAEKQQEEETEMQAIDADIAKEREEIKKLTAEGIMGDRKGGDKLMAQIAIFLSGFGAGLTGQGGNPVLEQFNRELENTLKQKNLSIKDKLAKKQGVFDIAALQLKKKEAATNDKVKKMQIQKMQNDIQVAKQKMYLDQVEARKKEIQAQKLQNFENRLQSGNGVSPDEERAYVQSLSKEDRKRYVPGFGTAKDAEVAKKVTASMIAGDQIKDQLKSLENLIEGYGNVEFLDRGAVAAESNIRRGMQLQLKEIMNLGVLNGPDLDLLNEFTGSDFFSPLTTAAAKKAKIQGIKDFVDGSVNANLRAANLPTIGKTKREAVVEKMMEQGVSEVNANKMYIKRLKDSM